MAQGNGSLRGSLPKRHDGGEMFDSKGVTNLEHPQSACAPQDRN